MPMDAGAIGIRPVAPEQPTGRPEGVHRRDEGSSAGTFRPQTNVALKTAIEDLAGTLSKISSQEKFGIAKMPQEVGDIVKNILQQSFSMQETLAQGVGSTIESQRFSIEQLAVFARMLSQIGALADKGFSMQLSDETQVLLSQFKNLLVSTEGGSSLEPVLMSKAAFELIDSKNPEQLPQALYEILSQLAAAQTSTAQTQQPDEGMQFLKQLVQYFMPRPKPSETPQQQTQQNQNPQQQAQQNQNPTRRFLSSLFKQYTETSPESFKLPTEATAKQTPQGQQTQQNSQAQTQQNAQAQTQQNAQPQTQQNAQAQTQQNSQPKTQQNLQAQTQQNAQPQTQQNAQPQTQQNAQPQTQQNSQAQTQQNAQPQTQQNAQAQTQQNAQPQTQQNAQPQTQQNSQPQTQQNAQPQTQQMQQNQNPASQKVGEEFLAKQMEMREQMQTAKTTLLKQPLQNDSETMGVMKNLAQLLMRNMENSPRTMSLLQNFVNNTQTMMPETEARHLQNLLRLCQQNVPLTVQQAAVQQNLPDLPRLWAFMQLCEMAGLTTRMNAKAFKRAGKDVAEFANGLRQAMGGENSAVQTQRSFQMMLPLYLGENESSYPTYLSVYDENEKDKETGEEKKETWVRICILTDNIGAVDLTFRVYEENQLDMRFYFSQKETAEDFRSYMNDLRDALQDSELQVADIRIGSVGEKMKVP